METTEKENQILWTGQEKVPDGLYTIDSQKREVPYYNYSPKPEKKPEKITSTYSWEKNLKQKGDGTIMIKYSKLSELLKTLKIDHSEPQIKENILKMICLY